MFTVENAEIAKEFEYGAYNLPVYLCDRCALCSEDLAKC
jgi:hypothetical protein